MKLQGRDILSHFRSYVPFTSIFFVGFALLVWFATRMPGAHIDLFENGHWLGPASDMLAGKTPYRETFPVHGFLCDGGMDFLAFSLFGASFSVSVAVHQSLGVLFQPVLFLIAAAATRKPQIALVSIVVSLGFAPALVYDRPIFPLASLAAFIWALDGEHRSGRLFFAGLLGGLGLLYALEFGTFVLLAEVTTIGVNALANRREALDRIRARSFFLGACLVLLPFSAWLAARDALLPFIKTSFWDLPRWIGPVWGLRFPAPWEVAGAWLHGRGLVVAGITVGPEVAQRLYLSPVLALLGLGMSVRLWRKPDQKSLALRVLVLSVACGLFFRYAVARLHLEGGNALSSALFLLLLTALHDTAQKSETRSRRRWRVVLLSAAAVVATITTGGPSRVAGLLQGAAVYPARMAHRTGLTPLETPRGGGILVPAEEARNLGELVAFSARHAAERARILDLSNQPALYFFLRRVNPTRFYQVPLMAPFQDDVLRDLKASPPAFVFLQSGSWLDAMDGIPNSQRIPKVWDYVLRNYPVREQIGETLVARPGSQQVTLRPAR